MSNIIIPLFVKQPDDLQNIPGVGKSIAQDLRDMGIFTVRALRNKNPERLYAQLIKLRGSHVDRCMLYVFRCAVYFASHSNPEPEKLQWWYWKDKKLIK